MGPRDLAWQADAAVFFVRAEQELVGRREVAFRRLFRQPVFAPVAREPDRLRRDQLDVVERRSVRREDLLHVLDVRPVFGGIEGEEKGEDHTVPIRFGELREDRLAERIHGGPVVGSEHRDHRLDRHVVVKEPQIGDLRELLSDGHLAGRRVAEEKDQLHRSASHSSERIAYSRPSACSFPLRRA